MSAPSCVHSFLDTSTAHITKKDSEILADWARMEFRDAGSVPFRTIPHHYGWFVHVRLDGSADGSEHSERKEYEDQAREAGISESFFKLQKFARSYGCWWINLDRDADEIEGLDTHDW